jgi:hypothetical protein
MARHPLALRLVQSDSRRKVTFNKRRASLFKKAMELGVLTNARVAVCVWSEDGELSVFGNESDPTGMVLAAASESVDGALVYRISDDQHDQQIVLIDTGSDEENDMATQHIEHEAAGEQGVQRSARSTRATRRSHDRGDATPSSPPVRRMRSSTMRRRRVGTPRPHGLDDELKHPPPPQAVAMPIVEQQLAQPARSSPPPPLVLPAEVLAQAALVHGTLLMPFGRDSGSFPLGMGAQYCFGEWTPNGFQFDGGSAGGVNPFSAQPCQHQLQLQHSASPSDSLDALLAVSAAMSQPQWQSSAG